MSSDASRMYSKNLTTFLRLMISDKGEFNLDLTDEIIKGTLVTHQSQIVHEVVRLAVAPGGQA
jgi:NAD/NADP transhydrogenase alpha subunit